MKSSTIKKSTFQFGAVLAIAAVCLSFQSFQPAKSLETHYSKKVKIVEIPYESEVIDVSAEKLWSIVGEDFANAGKWATTVDHSSGSGKPEFNGATCSDRSCNLNAKGFSSINEKLTQFDTAKKELSYVVNEGFPKFVTLAQNHWKVISVSKSKSKLKMTVHMEMKPFMGSLMKGAMKKNINSLLPVLANDLRVYAETGQVSESKRARIAKLNK